MSQPSFEPIAGAIYTDGIFIERGGRGATLAPTDGCALYRFKLGGRCSALAEHETLANEPRRPDHT